MASLKAIIKLNKPFSWPGLTAPPLRADGRLTGRLTEMSVVTRVQELSTIVRPQRTPSLHCRRKSTALVSALNVQSQFVESLVLCCRMSSVNTSVDIW